jgi:hypothetical protein
VCGAVGGCYGDFGAGAISVSFCLTGVSATVVSNGSLGYFGNRSGGMVSIDDSSGGGCDYLAAGATNRDGMVEESIGVLFDNATLFSAHGGGIILMTPAEHLDARIFTIRVTEPASLPLLGSASPG